MIKVVDNSSDRRQKGTVSTLWIVCVLFFAASGCRNGKEPPEGLEPTDYLYYRVGEEKIPLLEVVGKFYIEFYADDQDKIEKECAGKGIDLYYVRPKSSVSVSAGTEGPGGEILFGLIYGGAMEGACEQCAAILESTVYWSPVYKRTCDTPGELMATSRFFVFLKPETTEKQLGALAEKNAVEMISMAQYDVNCYLMNCTNHSKGNALELANLFYESGLFDTSVPVFIEGDPSGCEKNEPSGSFEATDYYWYGDKKIFLQKMEGKYYIEFYTKEKDKIIVECSKKGIKLSYVSSISDWAIYVVEGTEGPGAKIFTNLMNGYIEGVYERCAEVLSTSLYWSPFYENQTYGEIKMASAFTVILKPGTTLQQIEDLSVKNAVEMIGIRETFSFDVNMYIPNGYMLACTNRSKGNSLEMANLFFESGLFETTSPSLIGGRASEY